MDKRRCEEGAIFAQSQLSEKFGFMVSVSRLSPVARAGRRHYFEPVGAVTKYEIAKAIGRQISAFAHRMPKVRKAWMSADAKQSLFDAAALGLVYYGSRGVVSPYDGIEPNEA